MKILIFILLSLCPALVYSQQTGKVKKTDTLLNEIFIRDNKKIPSTGIDQNIDSTILRNYQFQNLQQLLQLNSNVIVKNYGVSNFSTLSIRGSSAAQTSVVWNGININNALTGISDLSTLPVSLFDEMRIQYGGATSNNSPGGGIILNSAKPIFLKQSGIEFGAGYESIKNMTEFLKINNSTKKYFNSFRITATSGNNSYLFYNKDQLKQDTLTHARSVQWGIANDFHGKINSRNVVSLHNWIQYTIRDIPPASFEVESKKNENILSFRNVLNWAHEKSWALSFNTGIGAVLENYQYSDSAILLNSVASVYSIPFYEQIKWRPRTYHTLNVDITASTMQMLKPKTASLNKAGIQASYTIENIFKRITLKSSVGKEITDVFMLPFSGSIASNIKIFKGIHFYQSLSANYRMPTLNELYYVPGGNPLLKPETSRNIEGGLLIDLNRKKHLLHADLSLYHREVKNWIVWYGNSILTPHNIQEVASRGLETQIAYEFSLKQQTIPDRSYDLIEVDVMKPHFIKLKTGLLYAYTLSTTTESAIPNDYSMGKQIPYVPRYQVKWNAGIFSHKFELQYIFTYTGYRFVTTDESIWLMPYGTSNVLGSVKINAGKLEVNFFGKINNLANANYESIVGRIMPGRNFAVGLRINVKG